MNSCSRVRVDAEILGRGIAGPEFLEEIRPREGGRDGKCSRNFKNVRFNAPFYRASVSRYGDPSSYNPIVIQTSRRVIAQYLRLESGEKS